MRPIRLILVAGHRPFREKVERTIHDLDTMQVIRTAPSAAPVFEWDTPINADLALIDIDLPDGSGLELCRWLRIHDPSLAVVMVAGDDWDVYLVAARNAFASGVVLRSSNLPEMIPHLVRATASPVFTPEQLRRVEQWAKSLGTNLTKLTPREWQVLWLAGSSNQTIARKLSVQVNTVEKHMSSILQKLNLPSRTQLVQFIYTYHLDALEKMGPRARFFV